MNNISSDEHSRVRQALTELKDKLSSLPNTELGYPLGDNVVRAPSNAYDLSFLRLGDPNFQSLLAFYELCDGINLPDIGNGLFIHTRNQVATSTARGLPVALRDGGAIFVFGSDGGGGALASMREHTPQIVHLPVGAVANGVFDNVRYPGKVISETFLDFLWRVTADVDAFIAQRQDWSYIA